MGRRYSLIVPCEDVSEHIDLCVYTLVKQNVEMSRFEIILIDNASTDDTYEKICVWEKRYPENIILVHLDERVSPSELVKIAKGYSSGEYIGFIHGNDWMNLYALAMFDVLMGYGPDIIEYAHVQREKLDEGYSIAPEANQIEMFYATNDNTEMISDLLGNQKYGIIYKRELLSDELFSSDDVIKQMNLREFQRYIMTLYFPGRIGTLICVNDYVYYHRAQ